MKTMEPISSIMTSDVYSIRIDEGLKKALEIIKKHKIRHLPVTKDNQIVGIISSSDLNRLTFSNLFEDQEESDEAILEMLSVNQVMSSSPHVVNPGQDVHEVAKIFAEKSFHSLPVVDGDQLVGIVTTTDIIKYFLRS